MNKSYYKETLEKQAGILDKSLKFANKHKKALVGTGLAAGAAGGAYAFGSDDTKRKVKKVGKSIATGYMNGSAQDMVKNIGGVAGLALAMKKGNSLSKSIAKGLIPGMAAGDIIGAATIPTYQTYKKHKKEFGTAPDAKTMGKVLAVNVLPTAGVWGGIYGAKKALQSGKLNPKTLGPNAGKISQKINSLGNKFKDSVVKVGKIDSNINSKVNDVATDLKNFKNDFTRLGNSTTTLNENEVKNLMNNHVKKTTKSILGVGGAFAPIALLQEGAALPTYVATPENIIDAKKKKIKQQQLRG